MSKVYCFRDVTRGATLADSGRLASNAWHRLRGLLGTKTLETGEGLLLRPCQSVHTFFMAFPIDVVFVDRYFRIVELHRAMPPFRLSRFVRRARFVIELPAGTIERVGAEVGDLIAIEPAACP